MHFKLLQRVLIVSRYTLYGLLIQCISLSLLLASPGNAQYKSVYDARLTISFEQASLRAVLHAIEARTDYRFVYQEQLAETNATLTLPKAERTVADILLALSREAGLSFRQVNNNINIRSLPTESANRQRKEGGLAVLMAVTGKVTSPDGESLPGVNVVEKGTTNGTVTDIDGNYRLDVAEDATLIFSFIGYKTQEIAINGRGVVDIIIEEDVMSLEGVEINAGYYTVKKREQTGNIARVTSEEIELQPIVSPLESLQGRMAGVEVQQRNGIPGSAPIIRIRGQNSLRYDGNYPLYIIDGVPINSTPIEGGSNLYNSGIDPLSTLNLSNIESIDVLKDADATAIYGSRGANGVVLITTKKGPGYNQKTEVEARVYRGAGQVSRKLELVNTEQHLMLRRAALENDGRTPDESSDYDLLLWDQNRYTDWQEELFGGTSDITDVNVSASGGNATTSFRLGGGYHKEGTVFPGDYGYHKLTTGLNLNHRSENKKLGIDLSVNYGVDQSDVFANGGQNVISNALILPPNAPKLYNEDGSIHWEEWDYSTWYNPLAEVVHRNTTDEGNNIVANLGLSFELFQSLEFKVNMGYTDLSREFKGFISKNVYSPEIRDGADHLATENHRNRKSWIIEPQVVYTTKVGGGSLDGLVGLTFQESESKTLSVSGEGFVSESLMGDLSAAEEVKVNTNERIQYKYNAVFARLGYNWERRYFVNLTGRRDGSSRFGPNKRFANFWAVGSAWIFTEEPFLKENLSFLSFGKLRGSYGTTGSDQIGDYGYLDAYEATRGANGLYPTQLTNPDYSWEENKKLEVAVELGFIQDRINLGVNWYRNRSSNQLVGYPLPSTTGFRSVQANLPATVQNTGWEVELSTLNIRSTNFRWQTFVNLTIPNNKLVSFPHMEQTSYAYTYRIGHPLNIALLYQYDGIDPGTGLYRVVDVNEDGWYDYEDQIVIKNIGRKYYGGITNNLSYKGFGLHFLWEFVRQEGYGDHMALPGSKGIQTLDFFKAWQNGQNSNIQLVSESLDAWYAHYYTTSSDHFMADASFMRLKTLSLSYSFPSGWLQKIGFNSCKFYLQAQNLFTITNYSGLNVEYPGGSTIPALRTITGGVQINL